MNTIKDFMPMPSIEIVLNMYRLIGKRKDLRGRSWRLYFGMWSSVQMKTN